MMNEDEMNESDFLQLVERHSDMLWQVCSGYSLSGAWEVDDAFQEVLCALWKGMPTLREVESERAWAYRVATNTMLALLRKQSNRPVDSLPPDLGNMLTTEMREDYDYIMELIDLLPRVDRSIVRAHIDGYKFSEIGEMVGLSEGAAGQRYDRAIKKIKKRYENKDRL
ncbi:MAG: RNA polymerase sigma factor [Bacteroidales bacterium]|nr:RNA polymerase sigma factor [Bacteroidales bacterium]